jgi:hypothetical protein
MFTQLRSTCRCRIADPNEGNLRVVYVLEWHPRMALVKHDNRLLFTTLSYLTNKNSWLNFNLYFICDFGICDNSIKNQESLTNQGIKRFAYYSR